MSRLDLECGCRSNGGASTAAAASDEEEDEESVCFSDADDEASCNSNFYSTGDGDGDGSYDDYNSEILEESVRASSAADPSDAVDLERGDKNPNLGTLDRDCRICHLSLVSSSPGSGIAIELGCSCKDDLAAAHKHCADTWFKIKGNKTCEICNSVARNVVGPNDIEAGQQGIEGSAAAAAATATSTTVPSTAETRTCLNGHRFLNFLLACMVFAFVISWLFHFNIPS